MLPSLSWKLYFEIFIVLLLVDIYICYSLETFNNNFYYDIMTHFIGLCYFKSHNKVEIPKFFPNYLEFIICIILH